MLKWSYFSMGAMAGIIAVLSFALMAQQQSNLAYAAPNNPWQDNNQQGLIVQAGGATQNQNDCLWVLNKHQPLIKPKEGAQDKELQAPFKYSLCLYRIVRNGEQMKLVACRDITYDMELVELYNDRPTVKDIYEQLKKSIGSKEK